MIPDEPVSRAVSFLVKADQIAQLIHPHNGSRDAIRHHKLHVCPVHVFETSCRAAWHFDVVVSARHSLVEPDNIAIVVDTPCLGSNSAGYVEGSVARLRKTDCGK